MNEKVLIKSEKYDVKKIVKIILIVGVLVFIVASIICFLVSNDDYDLYRNHEHDKYCYSYLYLDDYYDDKADNNLREYKMDCIPSKYDDAFSYAWSEYFSYQFWLCLIPVVVLALTAGLGYLWLHSYELTVTNKRIYGKVAWGKRVDLPVDSISATATIRFLKGVSVSTSSGRISFRVIKNADEIYKVMSKLLIERQKEKNNVTVTTSVPMNDEADQLKKYKDLLDSGVITQEEFNAKKKQLLGL